MKSDEHTTEAMWRRYIDKMARKEQNVDDHPQPKRQMQVKDMPLKNWINTIDLARLVGRDSAKLYAALYDHKGIEKRKVRRGNVYTNEWRWKR